MVLYTHFQTTLGRTGDPAAVARLAARATELQAPLLASGAAAAYLVAPTCLGALMPRYADGLPALRPLLPGMLALGLSWPARQALVTIGRPYRLALSALGGAGAAGSVGVIAAGQGGIAGVAWAMSVGYSTAFLLAGSALFVPVLGWTGYAAHLGRALLMSAWPLFGAIQADRLVATSGGPWVDLAARCLVLAAWTLPPLAAVAWVARRARILAPE